MLPFRREAKAVDFYKKAFGARELFRLDGENADVVARLAFGATVRLVRVVDDPDAVFKHVLDAGRRKSTPSPTSPMDGASVAWSMTLLATTGRSASRW